MVWDCRLIVREECFELGIRKEVLFTTRDQGQGEREIRTRKDQEFMIAVFSEMCLEPGMQDALHIEIDRLRSG